MADALDFVLGIQREKRLRETAQAQTIQSGFQNAITNQQRNQALQQSQQKNEIDSLLMAAKIRSLGTETIFQQGILDAIGDSTSGKKNNLPPGTSASIGGLTIPLNPKLTESEQTAIAGEQKFQPLVDSINKRIDAGVLDSGKNRTYTQFLAEGGGSGFRRMLTKDDTELEGLASDLAEMKKLAFAEGGKALSPTEETIVKAGLEVFGKGNAQIKKDLQSAMSILTQKKDLALGGGNAVGKSEKKSTTKIINGYEYEKRSDGKWHLLKKS